MAHAYYHAKSSAKKFGGVWQDYIDLHTFMDETKKHLADNRHRIILHNTFGITMAERVFGLTFIRQSDNKEMPVRPIIEQHITEDLGFIPTLEQAITSEGIEVKPWMYTRAKQLSKLTEVETPEQESEVIPVW